MDKRGAVLVVDDEQEFLAYVKASLEAEGHEVFTAASAGEAAKLLRGRRFDLILTDLRLPSASGLDVLAEARKTDPLSVGIVVTGHGSTDTALEALREGAYDYLAKPCPPDALAAAARRGIEHYRLKQALIQKTQQLEKLEAQLHDRSTLLQNVSHELKNPLSVVFGYSSFLLNHPEACKPEDVRKSVQSIHNNATRLGHLLEELVDSVRLHNQKIDINPEPVSVAKLCHEAAEDARLEAQRRGLALSIDCATDALVLVDAKRVHQILGNLLSNALKFTRAGGRVGLAARECHGAVQLTVSDTGVGIAAADLPRLFDRFYQVSETRKEHSGLGIGLDICRGLVELHGGKIWAESAPGRGSRFHFTLPLTPVKAKQ